jgi:hypothetical protein
LKLDLAQQTAETSQLAEQKRSLEQLSQTSAAELQQLKKKVEEQSERINQKDESREELLEVFEHAGIPSTSGLNTLVRKIDSLKSDSNEETTRR